MHIVKGARALMARLVLAALAAVAPAIVAPGVALAIEVHHILPQPGSALATAPDHLEVMFDEDLQPGMVQIGISPDATDTPVALPPAEVDGNLAVQPLPPLADGAYSAGFRVLGQDGHLYQGTFGFTVGAVAGRPAPAAPPTAEDPSWLVTGVAAGLTLPAAAVVVSRLRRRLPR